MTQPPYHEYPQSSPGDYNPHNRPDPYLADPHPGHPPGVDPYAPEPPAPTHHTGPIPPPPATHHTGPLPQQPVPADVTVPVRRNRPIHIPGQSPPTHHTGPIPAQHAPPVPHQVPQATHHTGPMPAGPAPSHHTGPLPTHHTGPIPTHSVHTTGSIPQPPPPDDEPLIDPRIGYAPFPMPTAATPPKRWRTWAISGGAGVLAVLLVVWFIVAGGDSGPDDDQSGNSGVPDPNAAITVNSYPPTGLLPGDSVDEIGNTAVQPLYTTLTRTDPNTGLPANMLAESITGDDDAREWTITLREGWTFHNGEPVTAESVVDSWNYVAAGSMDFPAAPLFRWIEGYDNAQENDDDMSGLSIVDDTTFTVRLDRSWASFPATLIYPAFAPLAPECVNAQKSCATRPIGTGPFVVKGGWDPGTTTLRYERWDEYPGDEPAYASVEFRFYTDTNLMGQDYLAGSGDLARISADQVKNAGEGVTSFPTGEFGFIGIPHYLDGYADAVFRRALSLAIDREGILADSGYTHRRAADGFTATGYPGSADDSACEDCAFAPDEASALFDQSDWPKDQTFELAYAGEDKEAPRLAAAICEAVTTTLGIDCEQVPLPYATLREAVENDEASGAWLGSWIPETGTADGFLGPLYGSGNQFGYQNDQFDQALAAGNQQASVEEALPLYAAAEEKLAAYMPVVPLTTGVYHLAHRDRIVEDSLYVDPTTQAPQFDLVEVNAA
ncbi:ABC transporter substrate-binding protein [Stackebrandtia soli]|uniref:ABC transporter substrate-binding protein n=1 Tax=Stackebrandtia soli TaxID=1892856 RepID=UPI0039ECC6B2